MSGMWCYYLRYVHPFLGGIHGLLGVVDGVLWTELRPVGTQT